MAFRIFMLIAACLSMLPLRAQFSVIGADTPLFSPEELIEDVCLGEGIDVLEISYDGIDAAVGRFRGGSDAVGLDQGFLITTGHASNASGGVGADNPAFAIATVANGSTAEFPAISELTDVDEVLDLAVYTIRFIPTGDTIMFRYVFASEEYSQFVCSRFNDVFGFFLTGPDSSGDVVTNNIAKIPGTDLPVTINTVNSGVQGSHFTTDISFCEPPQGSLNYGEFYNETNPFTFPVYHGYTDIFVAKAPVVPCQEYTMNLVLADVGDRLWDSGLFFEAKSFCSFTGGGHTEEELVLVEGCNPDPVEISLDGFPDADFPLSYTIEGAVELGTDLGGLLLDGQIDNPADSWLLPLEAIDDGELEGTEELVITLTGGSCIEKTVTVRITDPLAISGPADADCSAGPITLSVEADSIVLAGLQLEWSTGDTTPVIQVVPNGTTTYSLIYGTSLGSCTASYTVSLEPVEESLSLELCNNTDGITVNGTQYDLNNPTGVEVFTGGSVNGCDSIVYIDITPRVSATLETGICRGETLEINGNLYGEGMRSGREILVGAAQGGCDSVLTIDLSLLEADTALLNTTLCAEESLEVNGVIYNATNPAGLEVLENAAANGCDSTVLIDLQFLPPLRSTLEIAIEEGETFTLAGQVFRANGSYELAFTAQNGCDSIVSLELSVRPQPATLTDSIMVGQTAAVCVDTELFQSLASFTNACPDESAGLQLTLGADGCLEYTGLATGRSRACLVACNEAGICDTTYLLVSVFDNLLAAVDDVDTTLYNTPVHVPVLDNDWISETMLDTQYVTSPPSYGTAVVNTDGTITYGPDLGACLTEDRFSYAICNEVGCDTAEVVIWLDDIDGRCGDVWPGDVNNDGTVNQIDHWAIGLGYGNSGPARPDASNQWIGQPMIDWNGTITFIYEFNRKYADCNGNGLINADDTYAIYRNWGRTHPLIPMPLDFPDKTVAVEAAASRQGHQYTTLDIKLGEEELPLPDAYGLSFEFHYEPGTIAGLEFQAAESWLGTEGLDMMVLQHWDDDAGIGTISMVRTDQEPVTGAGIMGSLRLWHPGGTPGALSLRKLRYLQADGDAFDLADEVPLTGSLVSNSEAWDKNLRIYPNPVRQLLRIEMPEAGDAALYAADGSLSWRGKLQKGWNELAVNHLTAGLYVLKVQMGGTALARKVAILSGQP